MSDLHSKSKTLTIMSKAKFFAIVMLISFLLYSVLHAESQQIKNAEKIVEHEFTHTVSAITANTKKDVDTQLAQEQDFITHYGMDISHYQGDIVAQLKHHHQLSFIISKATQGASYVDPDFSNNWQVIRQHGFIRGAYHFYNASDNALTQAKHFTRVLSQWDDKDIAPILDIEQGSLTQSIEPEKLQKELLIFLTHIENTFAKRPIIYSNTAFAQKYLNNKKLAHYPLWLADYTKAKQPVLPDVWQEKGFKIWQKSQSYHLHSTPVDFDIYHGLLSDLIK